MAETALASLKVPGYEGQQILVNPEDKFVSAKLLKEGVWEAYETELFLKLLRPESVVLDIGANLGYYTVLASQACNKGSVFSFEPEPLNFSLLQKNIASLHDFSCRPEIFNLALGAASGHLELFKSEENPGDHQSYDRGEARQSVQVELKKGDELLEQLDRVDLIKIDVQGAELQVFSGLQHLIQRSLPELAIITEFYPKGLAFAGGSAGEFYQLLTSYGLKVLVIDHIKHKLWDFDEQEILDWIEIIDADPENEGFMNLLLIPEKRVDEFSDHLK